MNDYVAVEPTAPESASEIRSLISFFGPYTGRYIAQCPDDWIAQLQRHTESWSDVERARVVTLLQKAKSLHIMLPIEGAQWRFGQDWLDNIQAIIRARPSLREVVVRRGRSCPYPTLDEWDAVGVSDARIAATPQRLADMADAPLRICAELWFIDPYLDPTRSDRHAVLVEMLSRAARGRCEGALIIARAAAVLRGGVDRLSLEDAMARIRVESGFLKPRRFQLWLVDDDKAGSERLHARYLLGEKGAVRFDQGFQAFRDKRRMDVSVVGESTHLDLLRQFFARREQLRPQVRIVA